MKFDARAPEYARHARPQAALVAALVRTLPAGAGAEALELGAGTGLLTRELVRLGYRVTATDSAPGMIAEGSRGVPAAKWELRDAWAPGGACCDRLFSANLLQWAADPVAVLRAHRAALRPDGVMAHAILTEPTLVELRETAGTPVPLTWRTGEDWAEAARQAGFRAVTAEVLSYQFHYADALALLRSLHGTGAVPDKAQLGAGELRRVLREYDRRYADPAGGVYATWAGVLLRAEA